ncbi:D-alanyl-D-alanine carboxypeptidase family protein [Actibacterium mucosum]|uniref:D-alanyl-D-alanine carboxypeptidase family protein n=1 Tax=Actibacterium mucosum TaxID=1087332 RepID=UPI00054FE940
MLVLVAPALTWAAPYAAMVVDARSGKVLHSRNADTRLHPASLTKMMTLYIAFEAVERGEISLDTLVKVSKKAAAEPPSELGLRTGQKIKLRYLIRAAAVKSANDAATAIGEAIEGSEAAFARRMNRTAKALGMSKTTFKNAHGLTESGHLSTARDMTTLGRHLFYDYPDYYNLFSRITTDAGIKSVSSSNRRFLGSYKGADGIKTGYTRAAGFNLVASAERGSERIIATVFGGRSSTSRNAEVARLLDLGFSRAPSRVAVNKPRPPAYQGKVNGSQGKTVRLVMTINSSKFPKPRPDRPQISEDVQLALREGVEDALKTVQDSPSAKPKERPIVTAAVTPGDTGQEVVTRLSTSGGRLWGVNIGVYGTSYEAERELLQTALKELETFDEALRKVAKTSRGFNANFVGMTQEQAALACRRLEARGSTCSTIGPT